MGAYMRATGLFGHFARVVALGAALLASGCATLDSAPPANFARDARWAVLPFANATETPLAGQRAASLAAALMPSLGVADVRSYPERLEDDSLLEPGQGASRDKALEWARGQEARYALSGTVHEWRYKVGVDGEPVVGVSVLVIDVADGRVVWSSVGAKSGWSRESLAGVAQKLMRDLISPALRAR